MKHRLWMVMACAIALLLTACMRKAPMAVEETLPATAVAEETALDAVEACGKAMDALWSQESYHLVLMNDTHFLRYQDKILTVIYEAGQVGGQTVFTPEDDLFAFWIDGFKNDSGYFWEGETILSIDMECRENETQIRFQVEKEHGVDSYEFSLDPDGRLLSADINGAGAYPYILVLDTPAEEIEAAVKAAKG